VREREVHSDFQQMRNFKTTMYVLLRIWLSFWGGKDFENCLRFDDVTDINLVASFFYTVLYIMTKSIRITMLHQYITRIG